jgi:hypothetical protein
VCTSHPTKTFGDYNAMLMKIKVIITIIICVTITTVFFLLLESSRASKHEEYLRLIGDRITAYLGDNNVYPKNLKEFIIWEESVTSGDDPNKLIEFWLKQCVCPLTKHKPRSLDDVDEWADIKIIPYLSYSLAEEMMLAYCPAENHKDNLVYVIIHRSFKNATSFRQYYVVRSMSQEEFEKKLEEQRIAFMKVTEQ